VRDLRVAPALWLMCCTAPACCARRQVRDVAFIDKGQKLLISTTYGVEVRQATRASACLWLGVCVHARVSSWCNGASQADLGAAAAAAAAIHAGALVARL
jgi:hypothetical protein